MDTLIVPDFESMKPSPPVVETEEVDSFLRVYNRNIWWVQFDQLMAQITRDSVGSPLHPRRRLLAYLAGD